MSKNWLKMSYDRISIKTSVLIHYDVSNKNVDFLFLLLHFFNSKNKNRNGDDFILHLIFEVISTIIFIYLIYINNKLG